MEPEPMPPIGLKPEYVYLQDRYTDIIDAMKRYADAGYTIPTEWIGELTSLHGKLHTE